MSLSGERGTLSVTRFVQQSRSQMYTTFSALDAAIVGRILRKRKEKHRTKCGECRR
jgi:hypothetical protein